MWRRILLTPQEADHACQRRWLSPRLTPHLIMRLELVEERLWASTGSAHRRTPDSLLRNLILCLTLRPALHRGGQSCRRRAVTMQPHARNDLDRAEHRQIIDTAGTAASAPQNTKINDRGIGSCRSPGTA